MNKAGVYLHLPFCHSRCPYCSFLSQKVEKDEDLDRYVGAVLKEAQLWQLEFNPTTLYLGGGTPTLLGRRLIPLVKQLKACFGLRADAEITVEANPHGLSREYLEALKEAGVTRLSLGLQSSCNQLLAKMGRGHRWEEFLEVFQTAREVGFASLSCDLIYGLPGQSLKLWEETLAEVGALAPEHLSLYALSLEPGVPWAQLPPSSFPDDDLVATQYELATAKLAALGYSQYELSNWAKEGKESRHNLLYWAGGEYLGLGAGAHSFLGGVRFWNAWPPTSYCQKIEEEQRTFTDRRYLAGALGKWGAVAEGEVLSFATRRAEALILGLRLNKGVDLAAFAKDWGLPENWEREIVELVALGLLQKDSLRLTLEGRLLANQVFLRFLPE